MLGTYFGNAPSGNPKASHAFVLNNATGCEWTVKSFDNHDVEAVKAIGHYIDRTMNEYEAEIGGHVMKRLSKEGYTQTLAAPIALCDTHRDQKLHDKVLEVYNTFYEMGRSMGVE